MNWERRRPWWIRNLIWMGFSVFVLLVSIFVATLLAFEEATPFNVATFVVVSVIGVGAFLSAMTCLFDWVL